MLCDAIAAAVGVSPADVELLGVKDRCGKRLLSLQVRVLSSSGARVLRCGSVFQWSAFRCADARGPVARSSASLVFFSLAPPPLSHSLPACLYNNPASPPTHTHTIARPLSLVRATTSQTRQFNALLHAHSRIPPHGLLAGRLGWGDGAKRRS
eukprot:2871657-Rhodomonas_salina.1